MLFGRKEFLEFVVSQGDKGITLRKACEHFKCDKKRIANMIVSSLGNRQLKFAGHKVKDLASRKWLKVYVSESAPPSAFIDTREMTRAKNVMNEIIHVGHDEDFEPVKPNAICKSLPGSQERIESMRRRAELGEDIWHEDDVKDGWVKNGEIPTSHPDAFGSPKEFRVMTSRRGSAIVNCG